MRSGIVIVIVIVSVSVMLVACSGPDPVAPGDADSQADATNVVCTGATAGAYCGNDFVEGGDPDTLYQCAGPGMPPTAATPCVEGCVVEPPGVADHCRAPVDPGTYRLPWPAGVAMRLTQDCSDSCCADHVADDGWAWDFANGGPFPVLAARGGTITHLKINSTTGCGSSSCVNFANLIVIDHGDGTHATYLHLGATSLAPGITCGGIVERGQQLATAGTTGWSTGIHLHFQVGMSQPGAPTCECGLDGLGCAASDVPWSSFWSTPAYPTVPVEFDEWPEATSCANRRMPMPASQNGS